MKKKAYKKAKVVAKNNPLGSYVAGCPTGNSTGNSRECMSCERTN